MYIFNHFKKKGMKNSINKAECNIQTSLKFSVI